MICDGIRNRILFVDLRNAENAQRQLEMHLKTYKCNEYEVYEIYQRFAN